MREFVMEPMCTTRQLRLTSTRVHSVSSSLASLDGRHENPLGVLQGVGQPPVRQAGSSGSSQLKGSRGGPVVAVGGVNPATAPVEIDITVLLRG